MFLLLPFRHTRDMRHVHDVMLATWKWPWKDLALMRKFIRATFTNAPVNDQFSFLEVYDNSKSCRNNMCLSSLESMGVLDTKCYEVMDRDLVSSKIDMSLLEPSYSYIMSLSGGVDSMVLMDMLLKKKVTFVAVYIDYNNKSSSPAEKAFVKQWCDWRGVRLYVRTISEIHRPTCMELDLREIYETYTKEVRFATYKNVAMLETRDGAPPNVLLGHNKDDCFENILTNTSARSKYDNLKGMAPRSTQDGIQFLRPMLNIPKQHIITYARKNTIPFLYDSTPAWSQRGKIRDAIVPVLNTWNPLCIEGMLDVSQTMSDLYEIMVEQVEEYCKRMNIHEIKDGHTIYHIDHSGKVPKTPLFWKAFFTKAFNTVVSHKSLMNFLDRLRQTSHHESQPCTVVLNKYVTVTYKSTYLRFTCVSTVIL